MSAICLDAPLDVPMPGQGLVASYAPSMAGTRDFGVPALQAFAVRLRAYG